VNSSSITQGASGTVEWANVQYSAGGSGDFFVGALDVDPVNGNLLVAQTIGSPLVTNPAMDTWWANPYFCDSGRPVALVSVLDIRTGRVRTQNFYGNNYACAGSDDVMASGISFNPVTQSIHVSGEFATYVDFPPYFATARLGTSSEAAHVATLAVSGSGR
jgi:hypothetical protein